MSSAPMALHMVLDGEGELIDLRQYGTLSESSDELPRHLIEVVTERGGCWADEDEQDFWENWVMYPELSQQDSPSAFAAVRKMIQQWIVLKRDEQLSSASRVQLFLEDSHGNDPIQLMELEVVRIDRTVFTEDRSLED
jgi:hypothetical protein